MQQTTNYRQFYMRNHFFQHLNQLYIYPMKNFMEPRKSPSATGKEVVCCSFAQQKGSQVTVQGAAIQLTFIFCTVLIFFFFSLLREEKEEDTRFFFSLRYFFYSFEYLSLEWNRWHLIPSRHPPNIINGSLRVVEHVSFPTFFCYLLSIFFFSISFFCFPLSLQIILFLKHSNLPLVKSKMQTIGFWLGAKMIYSARKRNSIQLGELFNSIH